MSNSVDFSVVSIDPGKPTIRKGEKTFIQIEMKNNGPDILPAGEGTCQITLNNALLTLPTDRGFKNLSGEIWKLVAVKRTQGTVNLFFKTIADLPVNDQTADFQFDVKGKAYGTADVTLASSLSGTATSSDPNGTNQSASTQVIIAKR